MDKKTVLIVEDDQFLSSMYSEKLAMEGYTVVAAFDGAEGLEKATTTHPDIILLDIILPKMDGFEVLRRVRATTALKSVPVIMFTNLSDAAQMKRAKDLGADDYLVKAHFIPSDVVAKVRQYLR